MAENYCEWIISVGNMISTDQNVVLNDDELEMLVVLKMNKDFIQFMRTNYAHEIWPNIQQELYYWFIT